MNDLDAVREAMRGLEPVGRRGSEAMHTLQAASSAAMTLTPKQQAAFDAAKAGKLKRGLGARYSAYGERILPSTVSHLVNLGLIEWGPEDEHRNAWAVVR